jgi:hypothetical protein
MTKKNKVEGANLTDKQKQEIKKQILQQYPQLLFLQQELNFLIEQYDKDKDYVKNLMKKAEPIKTFTEEAPETSATLEIIKQGTSEYEEIIKKFEKNAKEAATIVE